MPRVANAPDQRRRRNKKASASVGRSDGTVHGPDLPSSYWQHGGSVRFLKITEEWWQSLRVDPRAGLYSPLDWSTLVALAIHHDRMVRGDSDAAREFRLVAKEMGITRSAANSLDWSIDPKVVGEAEGEGHEPRSARGRAADFRVHDGEGAEAS